jgi:hypothetical protein
MRWSLRSPIASTSADNTRHAEPHGTSSPADIQQIFVRAADLQFDFAGVTLVPQLAGLVLMLAATLWQSRGRDAK